jgi:hypothetical protein
MHFTQPQQLIIWGILIAILELGQLSFNDHQYQTSNAKQPCQVIGPIPLIERLLSI